MTIFRSHWSWTRPCFGAVAGASLVLHLALMVAYAGRWDKLSAVTIFPIWSWAIVGLGLAWIGRWGGWRRCGFFAGMAWIAVLLVCPDEWRGLWRLGRDRPEMGSPGSIGNQRVLRVVTLNCQRQAPAAREVMPWAPDIILFQERPRDDAGVRALALELWGPKQGVVMNDDCAILCRGKLTSAFPAHAPKFNEFVQATCEPPGMPPVEIVSLRLLRAVTDFRLWRPQTWRHHRANHTTRRLQLADLMAWQFEPDLISADPGGLRPCLIGGDFNAPAGDRIFQTLDEHFDDAFATVGTGWGDTFPSGLPLLRLDQIWATPELRPLRARVFPSRFADHSLLITDFLVE
jgi:Endonuclease/Exonuclease/phosphatase family